MANTPIHELAKKFKQDLLRVMPSLLEDWVALVRASDNPKDYLDLLSFGARLNALEPKNDNAAHLPVFHITFTSSGAVHAEARPAADVVDVEAKPVELPNEPPAEPAPFVLDIKPVEETCATASTPESR